MNGMRKHTILCSLILLLCAACGGTETTGPGPGPGEPARLVFVGQPSDVGLDAAIAPAVRVAIQDSAGTTLTSATDVVTLLLGSNPSGARLSGTSSANAVAGVATFDDLALDETGEGYSLLAVTGDLSATSVPFNVEFWVTEVAVGHEHTCALTTAGHAYCWGLDSSGQLGDGGNESGAGTAQAHRPVAVLGDLVFTGLAAASDHSCGLTALREVHCWGKNNSGQLGAGNTESRALPTAVATDLGFDVLGRNTGNHMCALTDDGAAYCWGRNQSGELGDAGLGDQSNAPGLVPDAPAFVRIAAGRGHTCALMAEGAAYCWGSNFDGELGDGTQTGRAMPAPVAGGLDLVVIDAGQSHTCGLTTTGAAYCWGRNSSGQLGDGTPLSQRTTPIAVAGGLAYESLSVGEDHACGLTSDGTAYCWGRNTHGRLGDGSAGPPFPDRDTPTPVTGGLTFVQIDAGGNHTCAVTAGEAVYCWGSNWYGGLGDGNGGPERVSSVPVRVLDPE